MAVNLDQFSPAQLVTIVTMLHENADAAPPAAHCYFVGCDDGPIKIGYSSGPEMRLKELRRKEGRDLRILALRRGGRQRESAYHLQFRDHRLHGEWFEPHPDILAEIDRLNGEEPTLRARIGGQ